MSAPRRGPAGKRKREEGAADEEEEEEMEAPEKRVFSQRQLVSLFRHFSIAFWIQKRFRWITVFAWPPASNEYLCLWRSFPLSTTPWFAWIVCCEILHFVIHFIALSNMLLIPILSGQWKCHYMYCVVFSAKPCRFARTIGACKQFPNFVNDRLVEAIVACEIVFDFLSFCVAILVCVQFERSISQLPVHECTPCLTCTRLIVQENPCVLSCKIQN